MVHVFFRDGKATKDHLDEKKNFKPTSQQHRKNPPVFLPSSRDMKATTVDDLRAQLKIEFDKYPISVGFNLELENIVIYKADKKTLVLVDVQGTLDNQATYVAWEVFDVAPVDFYRTVMVNNELEAVTFCHPDCDTSFTKVAPLMAAAMKENEQVIPWHQMSEETDGSKNVTYRPKVNGISVFCSSGSPVPTGVNPLEKVMERIGETYTMPSNDFQGLVNSTPDNKYETTHGITRTTLTHTFDPQGNVELHDGKDRLLAKESEDATALNLRSTLGQANTQKHFFSYKIRAGTNLKDHGFSMVYDNLGEPYHCSLVRESKESHPVMRKWKDLAWLDYPGVYMPSSFSAGDLQDVTRLETLLKPQSATEGIYFSINSSTILVYPCLAARFELHGFSVKTSAEPSPLDEFPDDDTEVAYKAASLVFSWPHDWEIGVYNAIHALAAEEYDIANLSAIFQEVLHAAIREMVKSGKLSDEDYETLEDAAELLLAVIERDTTQRITDGVRQLDMGETKASGAMSPFAHKKESTPTTDVDAIRAMQTSSTRSSPSDFDELEQG